MPEDPFEPARQTSTAVLGVRRRSRSRSSRGPRQFSHYVRKGEDPRAPSQVSRSPPCAARSGCLGAIPRIPDLPDVEIADAVGVPGDLTGGARASGPATPPVERTNTRAQDPDLPRVGPLDGLVGRHAGRRVSKGPRSG